MSDKEILEEIDRLKKYKKTEWTIEEMYQIDNAIIHLQYMLIENRINKAIEYNQKIYDTSIENERLMAKINLDILRGEDNEDR